MEKCLFCPIMGKDFLNTTFKAQSIKEKKKEKVKNFCLGKIINRMKRQATDRRNKFADHVSNEDLYSNIYAPLKTQ